MSGQLSPVQQHYSVPFSNAIRTESETIEGVVKQIAIQLKNLGSEQRKKALKVFLATLTDSRADSSFLHVLTTLWMHYHQLTEELNENEKTLRLNAQEEAKNRLHKHCPFLFITDSPTTQRSSSTDETPREDNKS